MTYLMTIDVGNTHIQFGLMKEERVVASFRLTTQMQRTSDEFWICMKSFLEDYQIQKEEIEDVVISCVVPERMYALTSAVTKYLKLTPLVIGPGVKTGIQIRTENPKEIGSDRIVNAVAAHNLYPDRNCIIVDFGTATTFDHVSKDGVFSYTIIEPGLGIIADALKNATAKLPAVEIQKPKHILMKNTVSGIQAGLIYGYLGSVEGILRQMKKELHDPACYVIATGGMGNMIAKETKLIDEYDPDIAYKGMYYIYQYQNKLK